MSKVLERKLHWWEREENPKLKGQAGAIPNSATMIVTDPEARKLMLEEQKHGEAKVQGEKGAAADSMEKKKFETARPGEQERITIDGLITPAQISAVRGLNAEFKARLMKIAQLHKKIANLEAGNRRLEEENELLRRQLSEKEIKD